MMVLLMSADFGGLELSHSDFVPDSDSEDGGECKADESVGNALVEETQVYDDDDGGGGGGVGGGGGDRIFGNNAPSAGGTSKQVIVSHTYFVDQSCCRAAYLV